MKGGWSITIDGRSAEFNRRRLFTEKGKLRINGSQKNVQLYYGFYY